MNKTIKRLLALILALMMVLTLVACNDSEGGGSDKDKDNDRVTPVVKDPKDDPAGYLAMALENTLLELNERYAGSPLLTIANLIDTKGTVKVSGDVRVDNTTVNIKDISVGYDLDKKTFLFTADVAAQGMEVEGGVVFSPDFVGVSFPMLLGDSAYYGFEPKNLRKQLENSPLVGGSGADLDDIEEELDMIDELLDLLWDSGYIDVDKLVSEMEKLSMDYIADLKVKYKEANVNVDGKKVDGYTFTTKITSDDLADLMEEIFNIYLDMPIWDTLERAGELTDVDIDMDELYDIFDDAVEDIRDEEFELDATFYVADKKVVKVELEYDEYEIEIVIDFYDDGNITADIEFDGAGLTVTSVVESGKKGYTHTVAIASEDTGNAVTITCEWDGDDLELSMKQTDAHWDYYDYTDATYEDTRTITISCGLSTSRKGFTISDLVLSKDFHYEYNDESYHDEIDIPLTLEYTSGGSVSVPGKTKNLLEMSEEDLMELVGGLMDIM